MSVSVSPLLLLNILGIVEDKIHKLNQDDIVLNNNYRQTTVNASAVRFNPACACPAGLHLELLPVVFSSCVSVQEVSP